MEVGASVIWIILRAQVECRIHPDIENGWTKLDCTDAQIMAVQEKAPSTRYTTLRQFVQRCSGNNSAHYRRVQDAGRQGTQYMEHHSQVAGIGYRKICAP